MPANHHRRTHGLTKTSEYKTWQGVHQRCSNPKDKDYRKYGGRGIRVCDRWSDFEPFYEDMGKKPGSEYSLDRIDVDGDYEPTNCRWATYREQNNNRRNTLRLNGIPLSHIVRDTHCAEYQRLRKEIVRARQ